MRLGMLGFGNVASATMKAFLDNHHLVRAKTGAEIRFVRVATRTPQRAAGRVPDGCEIGDNWRSVVDDPAIDVVLELTGDVELGREAVLRAIANGKHIVTANKALLALHGDEIFRLADEADRHVLFEGAVAVSIPIVKTLKESAAANRLSSVVGILNGTCNYVLSQMSEECKEFATAVAQAQERGFAEADPLLDISGEDAAHKIALLAALAFGVPIDLRSVTFKGIQDVERIDMAFAKRVGYQVKLIARAVLDDGALSVAVEPMLVPDGSMLAQVRGSMNGIAIRGDLLGTAFLYGSGAGGPQTASAVLADVIELANRTIVPAAGTTHNLGFKRSGISPTAIRFPEQRERPFYLRLRLDDRAGMLAQVTKVLADCNVSVSVLLQDEAHEGQADLVVITHAMSSARLATMIPLLREAAGAGHAVVTYPVLDEPGC
jgi:homoserine dehydrogenase